MQISLGCRQHEKIVLATTIERTLHFAYRNAVEVTTRCIVSGHFAHHNTSISHGKITMFLSYIITLALVPILVSAYTVDPPTFAAPDTITDCTLWAVATTNASCTTLSDAYTSVPQLLAFVNPLRFHPIPSSPHTNSNRTHPSPQTAPSSPPNPTVSNKTGAYLPSQHQHPHPPSHQSLPQQP